jgi:uncharacterized protein YecE (DUF72 family)
MHVRIGTSGWHYKHWRGNFYDPKCPASGMLAHYIRHFDAVEINNSFYRLPKVETLRVWRECTPPRFCFAVKASRFITHNKKLKDPQNALDRFLPPVVEGLGGKLGPILFQLPPGWTVNAERLEQFLAALPRRLRYTFEFRHPSWHVPRVYEILRKHNAAFCIFELAGFHSPLEITADFAYVRLHGPGGKYQGSYSDEAIAEWAHRVRSWRHLREVHVYFDNDQAGYAAENALRLKKAVQGSEYRIAS